ncbi:growth hormone-regulated TBC protein 1-A-like [Liolophura sinensis]|uniref:growth hormone-regulated TBC protein 1-A-like n=1 Tax=Liolophura sinensis TaxID=3198878 RepID=UPI0031593B4F
MSSYLSVLARRAKRWNGSIEDKKGVPKSIKVKRFCRKGIPSEHRASVWMCVSGAEDRRQTNPGLYPRLVSEAKDSALLETINLDIHRTFPENIYFAETDDPSGLRNPLRKVLTALAHKNQRTGYCQGLNFITGMLLLIVRDDEKVFWLMDTLINNILPDYYAPDMLVLQAEQEVLGKLVKWKVPAVYAHMESQGVSWTLVGMKWFICLYADVLPTETVLRIWDCLFFEGSKILFRVAVALIMLNKERILASKNFSELMDLFKEIVTDPATLHCHTFMQKIFQIPGSFPQSRIDSFRKECLEKVKGQAK